MKWLILILALLPFASSAQDRFPARYDVTDVVPGDVLNLRAGPGAAHDIIGALARDAVSVEVIGTNPAGTWGFIALPEGAAWASLRYLSRQPGQTEAPVLTQAPLRCIGNEPFWNADFTDDGFFSYTIFGRDPVGVDLANFASSANDLRASSFTGEGDDGQVLGVFHRRQCGDGMSDRPYGIELNLMIDTLGAVQHYSGCCSLVP